MRREPRKRGQMPGPKTGQQRAKSAKHLRTATEKKFRNDDPEKKAEYRQKLAARAERRRRKKR